MISQFLERQDRSLSFPSFTGDIFGLRPRLKSHLQANDSEHVCFRLLEETDRKVGQARTWEAKIETLKKPTMFEEANQDAIKKAAEEKEEALRKAKEREEAEKLAEKAKLEEQKAAEAQETRIEEVEQEREIVQSQSVPSEVSNVQNGHELPDSVKTVKKEANKPLGWAKVSK